MSTAPFENTGYILASDYMPSDGKTDVADLLQKVIDDHPNRTIFLPDGTYLLSHPILTPANPKTSVELRLSRYAVLKAADTWEGGEAVVHLGGKDPANDIISVGSYYTFSGGVIDGSGVASGISIDGGRETAVRDLSIKNTHIGLHIRFGANSGSSDADIFNVNIVGNGKPASVGVLLEGYDNTLTNMRIARVHDGVVLRSAGNSMRNLHPLYTCDYTDYENACGFRDECGNNWYDFCYSDHFGTGFRFGEKAVSILQNCFCLWYAARGGYQNAVRCDGSFRSVFENFRISFHRDSVNNMVLLAGQDGGDGIFRHPFIENAAVAENDLYKQYLQK